jgi:hypothetical protein
MPASLQGKKSPLLRGLLRSAAPGVAVSLACGPGLAAEPGKPAKLLLGRTPKPKSAPAAPPDAAPLSAFEEALRERDRSCRSRRRCCFRRLRKCSNCA